MSRTLVWTPMVTADLQRQLHQAGVGPAALVPVPSGTVLLPPGGTRLGQDLVVADKARKLAGSSVLAYWNDDAAVQVAFGSAIGRGWAFGELSALLKLSVEAKRPGFLGRLLDRFVIGLTHKWRAQDKHRDAAVAHLLKVVPQADETEVAQRLREWQNGGVGAVSGLFEALRLPQAAQVAHLADEGRADLWLNQLPLPGNPRRWYTWLLAPVILVSAVVGVLLKFTPVQSGLFAMVFLVPVVLVVVRKVRQPMKGQPISTALPVIPVTQGSAPTE